MVMSVGRSRKPCAPEPAKSSKEMDGWSLERTRTQGRLDRLKSGGSRSWRRGRVRVGEG